MQFRNEEEITRKNGTFTKEINELFKVECKQVADGVPKFDEIIINLLITECKSVVAGLNMVFENQKIIMLPTYMIISLDRMMYDRANS